MERSKDSAIFVFEIMGAEVSEIPRADTMTADLAVMFDGQKYFVEAKEKEDIRFTDSQEQKLDRGEVVSTAQPTWRRNSIGGKLKEANKQLKELGGATDFRLVWVFADGRDKGLWEKQVRATFYGLVELYQIYDNVKERRESVGNELVNCYYFDYCVSMSMTDTNGILFFDGTHLGLFTNEFADNLISFQQSPLYQFLLERNAIEFPPSTKNAIHLKCDRPLKDDAAKLKLLRAQTGRRYNTIRMLRHTATARIDSER